MADERDREPDSAVDEAGEKLGAAFHEAARRSPLARAIPGEEQSGRALLAAIGGVRGIVESVLPGLLFLIVYTLTQEVVASVLPPVAIAVVFILIRLIRREPPTTAIAGAVGIAISAGLALLTGDARDNFVPGFFINGGLAFIMIVSIIARWPFIGLIAGALTSDWSWRENRARRRVALVATVIWATFPLVRLAVELPLYFSEQTSALAAAKLILGVPLYAAVLWVTWLLVRTAWEFGGGRRASAEGAESR